MSAVSNHQPEVLLARKCHNPETDAHDMMLMDLDFTSGLWFPDDDYDSEERARHDDEEEARMLAELRASGAIPW